MSRSSMRAAFRVAAGSVFSISLLCLPTALTATARAAERPVDFRRDVRPILSNVCYKCHGPDDEERVNDLRLDMRASALGELESGSVAVVPGDREASELYQRVSSDDPDVRMPPPENDKQLTKGQVELLGRWIEQGADWQEHWSLIAPRRPEVPAVPSFPAADHSAAANAIDHFILARLAKEGLEPSPPADKETLIRRVTFDLTGLPPTLEEIDAFLADDSLDAYERLVDRLLATPQYGEQMARYWLDAARYGDTHGLHLDNERSLWPYRDWVIRAFNNNMPFDQFTVEQLGGDLLPNPTQDQLIATGFNRCNVTTSEGGSIPEEYRVRYAVDRVDTTSTVWLGLTMGCAVCHDHKFDPITQKEFYQLFAFFDSLTEKPMDGNALYPPPSIEVPSPAQAKQLSKLTGQIAAARKQLNGPIPEIDAAQRAWERDWAAREQSRWEVLQPYEVTSAGGATIEISEDGTVLAGGANPDTETYEFIGRTDREGLAAVRLEALTDESLPHHGAGRAENANFVLSEFEIEIAPSDHPDRFRKVNLYAATADHSQDNYDVADAIDGKLNTGWAVEGDKRRENRTAIFFAASRFGFPQGTIVRVRMRHEFGSGHAIGRFRLSTSSDADLAPTILGGWQSLGPFGAAGGDEAFDTDYGPESEAEVDLKKSHDKGRLKWQALRRAVDGKVTNLKGNYAATYLYRTLRVPAARAVKLSLGSDDAIKLWINGEPAFERRVERSAAEDQDRVTVHLEPGLNRLLLKVVNYGGPYAWYFRVADDGSNQELFKLAPVLSKPVAERSAAEKKKIRDYYRCRHAPEWQKLQVHLEQLVEEERQVREKVPRTMIMEEMKEPRETFVLVRGEYDKPSDKVTRGVPAAFPPLPDGAPVNRLGLAEWLVDPGHPLTARVTVNRYWQQYFGTGIVRTTEDFGSQGEWPSHPELLDWLATEFIESGWDVKHMQKLMVMSSTYRQSSRVSPELYDADPENRLLARGPRFRFDAEVVRDNALALSGLLVERVGGPSVKPYQPPGLWEAVGYTNSNTANFVQDHDDALYRRSMYIFWKRTCPPPSMLIFDAPSRESCTVRRARTNTPLQALVLMNDVQYVEAARHFAERIIREGGTEIDDRLTFAFRLATARYPSQEELATLRKHFESHRADFEHNLESARELIHVGESATDETLEPSELAAWTMIANLILNLDEAVTKS